MNARFACFCVASIVLVVECAAVAAAGGKGRAAGRLPHVTVIGDSVASALGWDSRARTILSRGLRIDLEVAACRRIERASCTVAGLQPPTLLELIHADGRELGPIVVIAVGYNDSADAYPGAVAAVLGALHGVGIRAVLWLTYRASHHDYLHMNDDLRVIARHQPELRLLDWNRYSRSHPDWFAPDGVHLTTIGVQALATFLRAQLEGLAATGQVGLQAHP